MKPQDVKFFKINEVGYDKTRKLFANELLIEQGFSQTIQIPSDITPGLYIFRTELLSLHGNAAINGPQFYTHCFTLNILGSGTVVPKGVTFPGGYGKTDPGVVFRLYGQTQAAFDNYVSISKIISSTFHADSTIVIQVIPGPPLYQGRYDPPTGSRPVVAAADTGSVWPADFEMEYLALIDKYNNFTASAFEYFDGGAATTNAASFFRDHDVEGKALAKERGELRDEAILLGIADPAIPSPTATVF